MILTSKLQKTLVEESVKHALLLRYPKFTRPLLINYNTCDGTVKLTSHLKSGNWCNVTSSLRGIEEMYKWLNSFHSEFPKFSEMMMGIYEPQEIFNDEINWKEAIKS